MVAVSLKKNFFKQKTAYEITTRLVGSEMCIRDSREKAAVYVYRRPVEAEHLELQADEVESVRWMDLEKACQAAKTQADGFCLQEGELLLLKNWLSEHTERSGRTSGPEAD